MKKIIYAVAVSALLIMASCGKKSNDAYTTYKGEYQGLKFTVEYPKTWNLEHNPNKPFCLFEAVSITPYSEDSLYQCVEMSTRVQQGMTLDSFVNERIDFFSQFEGFKLLEKEGSPRPVPSARTNAGAWSKSSAGPNKPLPKENES